MRRRSSGCHGRGSRALPRYDAPPAWRKPVSHVPAEQRVRERVVKDGHGEPVAMARTLLGARAGQGGRERLHGVPPASHGAHRPRPAAGGQRRRGRWPWCGLRRGAWMGPACPPRARRSTRSYCTGVPSGVCWSMSVWKVTAALVCASITSNSVITEDHHPSSAWDSGRHGIACAPSLARGTGLPVAIWSCNCLEVSQKR